MMISWEEREYMMVMLWDTAEMLFTDDLIKQAEYINKSYGSFLHLLMEDAIERNYMDDIL